ncbi:MAG: transglycosylase domain-containing protein [Bacillota bacterium]
MSAKKNEQKSSSKKTSKKYIFAFILILFFFITGLFLGGLTWIIQDTPDISDYRGGSLSTMIYSDEGDLINSLYQENRQYVKLDQIPESLQNAFIAIEDHNFYDHHGIDLVSIGRALITNLMEGRRAQGGSTITQQLARSALLSQEKTYYRKLQEAYLALQFERLYTKDEILEMYLNEIFLGHSAYGVEAASKQYFGKSVSELELNESALIAGLTRSPNYYSPYNNMDEAVRRRGIVLNRMYQLDYLNEDQRNAAHEKEIELNSDGRKIDESAPYFVRYVRDQLIRMFGAQTVYGGGLEVHTTINLEQQKKAEESIQEALDEGIIPSIDRETELANIQPQFSTISIEPESGEIKAMIGGRGDGEFNRATQAARQPGSAFKPFVYSEAILQGKSPASLVEDIPRPSTSDNTNYEIWPVNFNHQYHGLVSLRQALSSSLNVAAVNLIEEVGVESTINTAEEMGISTFSSSDYYEDHLSLALGGLTKGVTPLELTSAYGTFANNGVWVQPHAIKEVKDRDGNVLYEANPDKEVVFDEEENYLILSMLQSVIKDGTGWRADLDREVAGKTGTTNSYTDAWFVGFIPELATGVWLGEDSPRSMNYSNYGRIGSGHAVQIWRKFMDKAIEDIPETAFSRPEDIVSLKIDPITAQLPKGNNPRAIEEIFKEDNTPSSTSNYSGETSTVRIDRSTGQLATDNCPDDNIVSRQYLVDSKIMLGPGDISFQQSSSPGGGKQAISGRYQPREGMPLIEIDSETGIPERDDNGDLVFKTVPEETCSEHDGNALDQPAESDSEDEDRDQLFPIGDQDNQEEDNTSEDENIDLEPDSEIEDESEEDTEEDSDESEEDKTREERRNTIDSLIDKLLPSDD